MRRVKPEPSVVGRVLKTLQNLGYTEGTDFDQEVMIAYGMGRLWADVVLFFEDNIPIVLIEAEGSESEKSLTVGFEEGRLKAIAWNPEDPIPLLWIAAGKRDRFFQATPPAHGIGVRYKPLDTKPEEILRPDQLEKWVGSYLQRQGTDFVNELHYRQMLQKAFRSLSNRLNDHQKCQVILDALLDSRKHLPQQLKQIAKIFNQVLKDKRPNFALARAFRWLMRYYFRPLGSGKNDPVRLYGRYFTPSEVIRFVVEIIAPKKGERVLDFACGSGGFLMETAHYLTKVHNASIFDIAANLFGCDWNKTCVKITQIILSLLLPGQKLNVVQGNGLKLPCVESFDIVMSNPPAGVMPKEFSDWREDKDLPEKLPNLYEIAFLVQAVRMVKPGGRIGILLPDGILTNAKLKPLREWLLEQVQLQAVISLPRGLFPFTPSKMAVVIMQKFKSIEEKVEDHKCTLVKLERQNFLMSKLREFTKLFNKT